MTVETGIFSKFYTVTTNVTTNVVTVVGNSKTVLPRHAYGEVDPVTSDLCAT